jgi:glycosyltransferase involved in cell wall biosynthesis
MNASTDTFRPPPPLRIGIFTDTYAPQVNGVAISLQLISQGLREAGHEVTVFAPRFPGYKDSEEKVYRIPSLKYLNKPPIYVAVPGTPRTTWSLGRSHFDVLHAHSPLTVGLLAYLTASAHNLPLIYTYHTSITDYTHYVKVIGETHLMRYAARWFSTASTNLGDQIVVPSPKFERLLLSQKVKRPIHIIPNGIELTRFRRSKTKPPSLYHTRLGLHPESPILLSVGRVDPEKRLDFLINAFGLVTKRFPNAHLVFAGDGSARKDLEAKAAASPAAHRIHFLGMVNRADLPDLLHEAVMFLSASATEVHPISMIEAIAAGLPIVVVQDEAYEGMVEDGVNGRLVPPDLEAFSNAVSGLLANRAQLETFGRRSEELSDKFSIETQVNSLINLYTESIIQNWRGWDAFRRRIFSRWSKSK